MKQKRIVVPTKGVESWKELLADPEKHWKADHSAQSVAYSWENVNGVPAEITRVLKQSGIETLRSASLVWVQSTKPQPLQRAR